MYSIKAACKMILSRNSYSASATTLLFGTLLCFCLIDQPCFAQTEQASINSFIAEDGTGRIVVEARGELPAPAFLYTIESQATAKVSAQKIEQEIELSINVIQGNSESASIGISGLGRVTSVVGEGLNSWSVRQQGDKRFLDLQLEQDAIDINTVVTIESAQYALPALVDLTHLTPGSSVGFHSSVNVQYQRGIVGIAASSDGFAPLSTNNSNQFQTLTGGRLQLSLQRNGTSPEPIELTDTSLHGEVHANGKSIQFQLRGNTLVSEPNAEITILSGNAAILKLPQHSSYRMKLAIEKDLPVYHLVFDEPGVYPLSLDFVASIASADTGGTQSVDFSIATSSRGNNSGVASSVASSAIIPIKITGLPANLEFRRDQPFTTPVRDKDRWLGFLPATGRAQLQWKPARTTGEGKVFFTSTGQVDAKVGVGLLRQHHQIDYQVLQGTLPSLSIMLFGSGEILDVQGSNIVAWKVSKKNADRQLEITLGQAFKGTSQIRVRSQTPLGAFPVRVDGLRLSPVGAIRHSGHLRISNSGAVRVEPTDLVGLTQLAPNQFPGDPIEARQVFAYRFPAADRAFTIVADRVQPEVNVSQLVLYRLGDTDRVINADIELDIREAPIREWNFGIPSDYSVVSVTGASVADYITASEISDGSRNLKVIFAQDVSARQLVTMHLEKNIATAEGVWELPRIEHANAKSVRGDIGVIAAPGFRVAVDETELLVEKPLSYFPKPTPNLQQAFRIREPNWSASLQIEMLERNVQSDVFHLYSLSQGTVYGSVLINFFVTGAPLSELKLSVPAGSGNVMVDGQNVRTWRREDNTLIVSLHQSVIGPYVLLVTFEETPSDSKGAFEPGRIEPLGVQGERGYIQVVSPMQVDVQSNSISDDLLVLDPLELPAEFRLLSTAPSLGTWQYTQRPFNLNLSVNWFEPGTTATQVVEFSEANSRVSQDGELVTDVLYYVKSRGRRTLKVKLPSAPVRLWEVAVNGLPVTARQSDDGTLIPLPGATDPNIPVEVRLRLGKPTVSESYPQLALPVVFAPVLKTQWNVVGDEHRVLVPSGGTVSPPVPVLRPSGFEWVAKHGVVALLLVALCAGIGLLSRFKTRLVRFAGLIALALGVFIAVAAAISASTQMGSSTPLQLSLPVLSAGETVELSVRNTPLWQVDLSWLGLAAVLAGVAMIVWTFVRREKWQPTIVRAGGVFMIATAVLMQGGGAPWFFAALAFAILILLLIPPVWEEIRRASDWFGDWTKRRREAKALVKDRPAADSTTVTATTALLAIALAMASSDCLAVTPTGFEIADSSIDADSFKHADSIRQQCELTKRQERLTSTGTIRLSGRPGDRFILLNAPAVLTRFDGKGLRLKKAQLRGGQLVYVVSIPDSKETVGDTVDDIVNETAGKAVPIEQDSDAEEADEESEASDLADSKTPPPAVEYQATFEYQLDAVNPLQGIPVLTGVAAIQEVDFRYEEADWEVQCSQAIQTESVDSDVTRFKFLLAPGKASLVLKPMARDVTTETTQFFVEASNLYLPSPGVVDGIHRLHVRTSQGQVRELNAKVPNGMTVSAVTGPIGSWQFNADTGELTMAVEPAQSSTFDVLIETQRGLDPLPADAVLAPLKVTGAGGEVGLVAVAFGPDAQPESLEATTLSGVNLGDFDASLIPGEQAVLHRVYRYGADGGQLKVRVAPVESEVRVVSQQVLSLGDERIVLGVNFTAEISRAGLFQLSFSLPSGLEVESLSGAALHHWAELSEGDERRITMHLNGKTIATQTFSLTLTGASPAEVQEWQIPRFELNEAARQTGELVVRPTTGVRLRTVTRQNISEIDPRSMGGKGKDALAFRLLQRDWNLVLGIEKLDPWVTGQVLQDVMLREGQTRSTLFAQFNVQNASIRKLQVMLPLTDEDEIKTLRASGNAVSDFVRIAADSNVWEVRFKRRLVGRTQFQIEYERRGDREDEAEILRPAAFPQVKQLSYHFSVRTGGRLEVEPEPLSRSWQRADWSTVPKVLRESGIRSAPALSLKFIARSGTLPGPLANPLTNATPNTLKIIARRHSLADALKLRVAKGSLMTVLSQTGNQLTAVDLTMDVIQRSSLVVGLPAGGNLFSIFVNGESVHSIRQGGDANAWQFYILPGMDDRTAKVRFVYSVPGDRVSSLHLTSPQLNVPLENIQWSVVAPKGFELVDDDGNLELLRRSNQKDYNRSSYLSAVRGKRKVQAQQATQLLEQASQLLQAGEQTKARWALKSVANQYALDAASNEDARVQLENLQTQQAIVGLNTRRQRLYLDNRTDDMTMAENMQLSQAAADNPILQQDKLNFRPQEFSQLLRGNTAEDNAVLQKIAGRLVQHQRTTEPAPQAIIISLPEEGTVYTFGRTVQVAENSALDLDLEFASVLRTPLWRALLVLILLALFATTIAYALTDRKIPTG